jgi:hypothetical protein
MAVSAAPFLFCGATLTKPRSLFNDANFYDTTDTASLYLDRHLVSPFVFVYFFGGAELCTPGTRVGGNFS